MAATRRRAHAAPLLAAVVICACAMGAGALELPPPQLGATVQASLNSRIYTDSFTVPSRPVPGEKFKWSLWFENLGNTTLASVLVSVWANSTDPVPCGAAGADYSVTLKNVKPRQVKAITAKLKAPAAEGAARVRAAFDSDCKIATAPVEYTAAYSVNATETWNVMPVNYDPEILGRLDVVTLTMPVVGQPFELGVEFKNTGQLPSPDGLKVGLWYSYVWSTWRCGLEPNVTFTLPKIGPGKTYTAKVQLVAPQPRGGANLVYYEVDPYCEYPEFPRTEGIQYTYYDSSYAPMPWIWGAKHKKYGDLAFKLAPASPKAGATAKAKLTVTNIGNTPGVVGQVKVWLIKNDYSWPPITVPGDRCNYTGEMASASFNATTIEVGKTKKITVPDVPIPSVPGSYYLVAEFDTACVNPYSSATPDDLLYEHPPLSVITVK
ncbi:hypothetical protein Rsub_10752 [Raphidocelis subcapitata]|uniref:CARDB domain-containing protein n=1 Tax=Raphidocelis subcapitata TaxID=307507 RepID=A0A2V0PCP7_9CHLO|nr:hypothetical protein Rsub_10752 [Raphidocelis subcapitata]|eukprot:GBF97616.1 hypothetical protein Rsub_10752 [Raphidocelis subcapitata]